MRPKYMSFVQLSDEAFEELKRITIEEYGDKFTDFEIRDMGSRLLNLFAILTSPDEEEHKDKSGVVG